MEELDELKALSLLTPPTTALKTPEFQYLNNKHSQ